MIRPLSGRGRFTFPFRRLFWVMSHGAPGCHVENCAKPEVGWRLYCVRHLALVEAGAKPSDLSGP